MKPMLLLALLALVFLTACRAVDVPRPISEQIPTADVVSAPAVATQTVPADRTATAGTVSASAIAVASPLPPSALAPPNATETVPPQLPPNWQTVAWQGLTIPIPPKHVWEISQPNPDRTFIAPVLEYGRIAFDRAQALPDASELPDGMDFTILQWRGSLDDWLVAEQKAAPAQNPIDTNTVRKTAVAGQPAIAYSYMVTGVSNSQTLALKLNADRILLINNSNVDNPEYQAVLRWLTIGNR